MKIKDIRTIIEKYKVTRPPDINYCKTAAKHKFTITMANGSILYDCTELEAEDNILYVRCEAIDALNDFRIICRNIVDIELEEPGRKVRRAC